MGAAESTPRKLTIPNESHLIKITNNLTERLLACQEKQIAEQRAREKREKECPPDETEKRVRTDFDENIPPERLKYSGDALVNYYYGPSITSLRLLQAHEKELKESENYWMKRIEKLEDHHSQLKIIMEKQYNKAMDEINNQVPRPPPGTQFPCAEHKSKVIECYKKNPNQALLCAGEVSQFADCVHGRRIKSLQSKESSAC